MTLRFKPEKLVHALAFFSDAGVADLTKLKAAKLLYFADKEHLLRFGRPILGDVYFCLPYGPVPSVALNEMGDAIEKTEVEDTDRNLFRQYLEVKTLWNPYPVFKAKQKYDPDVFSESELEVLGNVVRDYGNHSARQLVELTHNEPTWKVSNQFRNPEGRASIPYELFFVGAPEDAQQMLDLFRAECEDTSELDAILNQKTRQSFVNA
ncbi:MAG: Panacea domain-containing protein [Candidatus Acidiferrum sp.]